ncbi:hypothetical protein SRU_0284 [Salinibacter ruber DSM 13855]|uniref:Uncharacterized protein n=1 Tax=Salinibacter ruber (strain DSM 13855 / M31) TaxID=309807 RepID=Q2S5V1_SALRD|nr:hypothetical protein SRU_0284 [Salinibacter ruber DSM 13855]
MYLWGLFGAARLDRDGIRHSYFWKAERGVMDGAWP